ncbi:MAG: UDP-N-acetylglucosamine 2-epimerase [Peptoanaerobacter stomatis]|uniref:UDP-N-acetylglucosamine 2-epimerase n=1 Tax=Peptoanaerobacter stomatis TaxID=796937 RepID=UPI003FA07BDD
MDNLKYKIAFATGSRADYGIMRRYLFLLNADESIDLHILTTGALLDEKYGKQVDLIYKDGFNITTKIKLPLDTSSDVKILKAMAVALENFGSYFASNKPDLLIILGDRYEIFAVALAAAIQRIPILHIHGGEATFGNYDEFIRHSITKMSLYHFTATEEYRNRVIQLGETPKNVFNLGSLGAENCLCIDEQKVPITVKNMTPKNYFVVLFHPETLTNVNAEQQIHSILTAITNYIDKYKFIFIGTNADTFSNLIKDNIAQFVKMHTNAIYFENLNTDAYHYLIKNAICLLGNSSSGIIEAPSLGVYTINIGDRQKGRVRGNSVIDTICRAKEIEEAIKKVLFSGKPQNPINPYYKKDATQLYYNTTKKLLTSLQNDIGILKEFYDMDK